MRLLASAILIALTAAPLSAQVATERAQRPPPSPGTVAVGQRDAGRGEPTWNFRELDKNGDRELTRVEFNRIAREVFRGWDLNQNNRIESIELHRSLFAGFDLDRDEKVSEKEFARAAVIWGKIEGVAFAAWDADRNGAIDLQEFRAGWNATGLFARWDLNKDMWLSDSEIEAGVFALWDADGNGAVAESEFNEGNAFAWL